MVAKRNSWTVKESSIIRKHYRDIGGVGCAKLLPKRTPCACCHQATKLEVKAYSARGASVRPAFEPMSKSNLTEYWQSLPDDGRDNTGRLMGDPAYGRSALHKKLLQVTETKDDLLEESGYFSDRYRAT